MELKPFLTLIRRISKTSYKTFLMNNRIIMQCYDINIDSDVGMHYMLFIPDTPEYSDSFYDRSIVIQPAEILKAYKEGHDALNLRKKTENIKSKFVSETFEFIKSKTDAKIIMTFELAGELIAERSVQLGYPVNENDPMIENCVTTIDDMLHRIKPGGIAIVMDACKSMMVDSAQDFSQVYYTTVKVAGMKIRVPLIKSIFMGTKDFDSCFISVQETKLDNIFLYSLQTTVKGITDQQFGYIVNF